MDESTELIEELLGGTGLPTDAMDRVVSGAGGTPLFIEQLLAMLVDDGTLQQDSDGWHVTGDLDAVTVPPTIGALLAARLERLSPGERQVLDAASVVGQIFYAGAAAELTALAPAAVAAHLRSLARKEMIRSERSDIAGEDGFAFSHVLVRDSAYQALPKVRRADLHERLARWLDKRADNLAGEADEFVGHHLAEAVLLRRSMGEIGGGASALAEEAATRLAAVAWRLMATDVASAATLYAHAAELVPSTPRAVDLRLRHGVALFRAQEYGASRAVLDGLLAVAERSGDRSLFLRSRLAWLDAAAHTDDHLTRAEISSGVAEALEYFDSTGDDEGLALAKAARTSQCGLEARWEAVVVVAEEVLDHATRCGDRHLVEEARAWRFAGLAFGPRPAREVLALLTREAETGDTTRIGYGTRRMAEGILLAYDDRPEEARCAVGDAHTVFEETHNLFLLLVLAALAAETERVLGDDEAAERHLTYMFRELERTGERSYLSTVAPELAELRWRQGDIDAARELANTGRSLALEEDVASQALWRIVAAKVAASERDLDRALQLAAEAVEWSERSDQLSLTADIHMGRAEVQVLASRRQEAEASLQRALELYEAKGNIPNSRRARSRLGDLAST